MRKLLISIVVTATLTGCSSFEGFGSAIPDALDKAPLIYRPEIQQGNVVTQDEINQLKPGMVKRQVKFLLGTPMLIDVFHQERWDYIYTSGIGSTPDPEKQQRVSLFFVEDRLERIEGDYRPMPVDENAEKKETVVTVPDWEPEKKTLWQRTLGTVGLGKDEETTSSQ